MAERIVHAFRPDPFDHERCGRYFDDAGAAINQGEDNVAKACGRRRDEHDMQDPAAAGAVSEKRNAPREDGG